MKLNQIPNFRVEDFPSEQSWINRLFVQLNPFISSLNQVLAGGVDYTDNIKSVSQEYSISTFQEFSFLWPHKDSEPNDVRVTKATKGTQQTPTILLAAWAYDKTAKTITISRLTEVSASSVGALSGSYKFTIRATV